MFLSAFIGVHRRFYLHSVRNPATCYTIPVELFINSQPATEARPVQEWQQVEFACAPPPDTTLELRVGETLLEPFLRPGDSAWRWRWNPQNTVGLCTVTLGATGAETTALTYTLRVVPRKLSQEHYALLLEHLQRDAAGLAAALLGGAEGAALLRQPWRPISALEEFAAFFGERMDRLEGAVMRAATHPHIALRGQQESVPLGAAATLDGPALAELARAELDAAPPQAAPELQEALVHGGGLLPRTMSQRSSTTSYDTYENRLVRELLDELLRRARYIGTLATRERERLERNAGLLGASPQLERVGAIAATCATCERRLRRLRALPFLAQTSGRAVVPRGPTHVLARDPAYRQLYQAWRDLRQTPQLALESPLFHLTIADLPALYEVWCAVQTALALLALPGWTAQQSTNRASTSSNNALPSAFCLLPTASGFQFRLPEDTPLLTLENENGDTLVLRYQARYRPLAKKQRSESRKQPSPHRLVSLDRHTRVPDLAVELHRADQAPKVIVLDAKYRLDATGGVPEDALADAYAYRGSIGRTDGTGAVAAALLLYPGRGETEMYASGVGALPLLPDTEGTLCAWLGGAISEL